MCETFVKSMRVVTINWESSFIGLSITETTYVVDSVNSRTGSAGECIIWPVVSRVARPFVMVGHTILTRFYLKLSIEVIQEACPFPIIIDNLLEIICVGHFECMITVTHNTFYNSQLVFLGF